MVMHAYIVDYFYVKFLYVYNCAVHQLTGRKASVHVPACWRAHAIIHGDITPCNVLLEYTV